MKTLGFASCLTTAALVLPVTAPSGEAYLRFVWDWRIEVVAAWLFWTPSLNWLFRQALVLALRTPGSRLRAAERIIRSGTDAS